MLYEDPQSEYCSNKLIHYSYHTGGNASEYIIPKGKIDITSHGIGSGIYGLSRLFLDENPANVENGEEKYVFEVNSSFIINNEDECERYITASRKLLTEFQYYSDIKYPKGSFDINYNNLMYDFLNIIENKTFNNFLVLKALKQFWYDYETRIDFVNMPINYILLYHGFDSVQSYGTSCHSWSKGDVKFIPYPTYELGDTVNVVIYLTRKGIEKPKIDLRRYNYQFYEKQKWRKM